MRLSKRDEELKLRRKRKSPAEQRQQPPLFTQHPLELAGTARVLRLQKLFGNTAVTQALIQRSCMLQDPPPPAASGGGGGGGTTGHVPSAPPPGSTVLGKPGLDKPAPGTPALGPSGLGPGAGGGKSRPTLYTGKRGAAVKDLQQKLNDAGAKPPLAVDGIFGPKTRAAAVDFQKSKSLTPDGIVGKLTWGALDPHVARDEPTRTEALGKTTIQVVGHGASDAAIKAAEKIQDQTWKNLDTPTLRQVEGLTVELHVIPHDKKMTDLDEFKALKGTKTFDGRIWDDVRGINMGKVGTKIISAVGEETLVAVAGKPPGYALGFVAAHESGHAVRQAMTPAQDAELVRLYEDRVKAKGKPAPPKTGDPPDDLTLDDWLAPRWYTAANADEYLANSISAFYNHPYSDDEEVKKRYTRDWLRTNDLGMYRFLAEQIYKAGA